MNIAIILSGGTGSRVKGIDIPKQYCFIQEKPVIYYCMRTIAKTDMIDRFLIVASEEWRKLISEYLNTYEEKFIGFTKPGKNRQLSIYNALVMLQGEAEADDIVLVHDAARPLVSEQLLKECIQEAEKADGAMPVLPMKDTVYFSEDRKNITSLLKRENIFAGQAPESFRYGKYLKANQSLLPDRIMCVNGSSEPALLAGMNIRLLDGDESNLKITTKEDLEQFQKIIEQNKNNQ